MSLASQLKVHIRWMIRRDMSEVLSIEKGSFSKPWQEEDFLTCLRNRNVIGMVAEIREQVVGYMIHELHNNHLTIVNFAVDPDRRRQAIGSQMIAKLVSKLASHRRTGINLVVRETNVDMQLFLRNQGFRATKVLRSYYDDSGEAGYEMWYRLAASPDQDVECATVNRVAKYL
jgi:ribosomal-protein-alanine N-acetyltransferase